jgi:hypothetical protein
MYRYLIFLFLLFTFRLEAYPIKITSWNLKNDVKTLNSLFISVSSVNSSTQTIFADIRNENDASLLSANGFVFEKLPDMIPDNVKQLIAESRLSNDSLRSYYTLAEYNTFMTSTAAQYPEICQLVQFGSSVQNRPLYFLRISDNINLQEPEPEFRLVSSIHGNEVVGYDILIRLIQLLTAGYGNDGRITNIVDNSELWICPMFNPDGYTASSRYNANGVDLNRNFPLPVGSQHPDGMTWQAETMAFMNHANANSITFSVNYHGGALVVNYPWDYTYTLAPDNDLLIQAALSYSSHNNPMYNSSEFSQGITNGAEWYIALGTLQDWSYAFTGGIDFTIEVSNEYWPNSSQLDVFWTDNQESLLSLMEFVQYGVHGSVTDNLGNPLPATISFNNSGADVFTDPQVGDYHKVLLSGTYTLTAQATDYAIDSAEVVVPLSGSVTHNFILQPITYTAFSGTVVNQSGAIISGASVKLTYGTSLYESQTDNQGLFSIANLPVGVVDVIITAGDYGIFRSSISISDDNNKVIFVMSNPMFADNFESGTSNWNLQNPWALVNFANTQALADSPSGNYSNNIDINASFSSPISLVNVISPTLSYDIRHSLETNYDFLYVQVSINGITWITVKDYTGSVSNWLNESIPLNDYIGSNLYVRFKLVTDNSITADGVYIDNVMISGFSESQTIYGDIDSNWVVDMTDVQNIMEYSVGNDPIPQIDQIPWEAHRIEAADVDDDNQVTATDAYYIYTKINQYDSPFPAQGGVNYSFEDPLFSINIPSSTLLHIMSQSTDNLKSFTIDFSSTESLVIDQIIWNNTLDNVITSVSNDSKKIAFLPLNNAVLNSNLIGIQYHTVGNYIHCTGLVNDSDIDYILSSLADEIVVPFNTSLIGNYPNPFYLKTTIMFSLAKDKTPATISIYNVKGQLIKTIANASLNKGMHKVMYDGKDSNSKLISNGIYFYEIVTPEKTMFGRMVMLK